MVRGGTSITFQVQGGTASVLRPDVTQLRASVIAFLSGYFFVESVEINVRSLVGSIMAGEFWNYDYTAIVQLTTRGDYASSRDIASVIAHSFYAATGGMPTVSTDFRDSLGGITDQPGPPLLDSLTNIPQLLVLGIVLIVGLIAFSPAGKALGANVGRL